MTRWARRSHRRGADARFLALLACGSLPARARTRPSFDKQFLRDYLDMLDWNKTPPAPRLPAEVILQTARKYREAYERLTGESLPFGKRPARCFQHG